MCFFLSSLICFLFTHKNLQPYSAQSEADRVVTQLRRPVGELCLLGTKTLRIHSELD